MRSGRRCFAVALEECFGQEKKDERWPFSTAYRCRGLVSGGRKTSSTWCKGGRCQQGDVDSVDAGCEARTQA
ncbi:hypothetical protein JG688_00008437 [Phytophthora aleatoria]|uniref:Uncharacterized protein n=1 Tax=Phytophthora aleatoria TaxID=2496075 RepID=A0A8J5INI5_9STRA|nr:hypothetical protein JG688_00008437 [Phytophthora aleatoria]